LGSTAASSAAAGTVRAKKTEVQSRNLKKTDIVIGITA